MKQAGLFGRNERERLRISNFSSLPVTLYVALEDPQFQGAYVAFKEVEEIKQMLQPSHHIVVNRPPYNGIRAKSRYLIGFSQDMMYYMSLENSKDEIKLYDGGIQSSTALTEIKQQGGSYYHYFSHREMHSGGLFWKSAPVNPNLYVRNFTGNPVFYDVGYGTQSGSFLLSSAMGWVKFNGQSSTLSTSQDQTIIQKPLSQGFFGKPRRVVFRIPYGSKEVGKVVLFDISDGKEDIALYMNQVVASKTGHVASVPIANKPEVGFQEKVQPQKAPSKPTPAPIEPPIALAQQKVSVSLALPPSGAPLFVPEAPNAPNAPNAPLAPEPPQAPLAPTPPQATVAPLVSKQAQQQASENLSLQERITQQQQRLKAPPPRTQPRQSNNAFFQALEQRRQAISGKLKPDVNDVSDIDNWNTGGFKNKYGGFYASQTQHRQRQPTVLQVKF